MLRFLQYFLLYLLCSIPVLSQDAINDLPAEPNYIYAAVLGTGVYRVEDATLTTVRLPFSYTLDTEEEDKWRLLLPVVIGYASLDPDDIIDRWIPTNLGTLSFIPGIEYRYPINDTFTLKPFAQVGGGYDFENNIWSGLVVGGTRALWKKPLNSHWQMQLGS
ncbi:hypothetical protein [Rubritalea tangerina]|uniref:Transporter n=1 Tax=Rubritalea tangerina TaxID=430798 RepID=A0ABW4ZCK6_9BACT